MLVISVCRCAGKGSRNPVPYCTASYVTLNYRGFCLDKLLVFLILNVYEQESWQFSQMAICFEGSELLGVLHGHTKCSSRKLNEICICSDTADWHRLFCLLTYGLTFFPWKCIDVGFPSAFSEYVLLPLVNREAASAYGKTEYSHPGRDERERVGKIRELLKETEAWNLFHRPQSGSDT